MYYLQSRYYDPEVGRFLNGDTYVSTGQGFIGSNMFVYCLNNPVCHHDPSGKRAPIWPILFGDHRFGFIHEAVQLHIVATGLFEKELFLAGIGRADIIDPETMEVWEIKHGGSTEAMQNDRINQAQNQLGKYITNKLGIPLKKGHAGAFTGAFVINCGKISYEISYDTPEPGVILYYVQEMKNYEPAASFVYIPSTSTANNTLEYMLALAAIGGGLSALDSVCKKHYAITY